MLDQARATVRRVVVSLLMLATLLVYAMPAHAAFGQASHPAAPHEHALSSVSDAAAAADDHEHGQPPCEDSGLLDDAACCSVASCTTMHGGLLAPASAPFVPVLVSSGPLPALATPEGIGSDPALRPPRLTI